MSMTILVTVMSHDRVCCAGEDLDERTKAAITYLWREAQSSCFHGAGMLPGTGISITSFNEPASCESSGDDAHV